MRAAAGAVAPSASPTRERLLGAAGALFAERGFHGTKIRDIAARAGVNVAAGNYHFGSKKALYLAVLRAQFAEIWSILARRGAGMPSALDRLSRAELVALLRARMRVMLEHLIGPPPSAHGTLMLREMADPTEALPVIVREFVAPMLGEMRAIVARLEPGLPPAAVEACALSLVGQALFYRVTLPAMHLLRGERALAPPRLAGIADHIVEFSLGGMARTVARRGRGRAR
ncbi:MAG TPA: CerR family C-terminal domain-containing protein [Candidatus Binatia bacterium]|nr:CerR family C-terminal domain-containing protein [Candidatus Binatia bacterium]